MRVVFRADATRSSGTGHVMRCWALAEEMCALGATVAWQGRIDVPWVRRALDEVSWSVHPPHGSPAEQARQMEADVVVVDSYSLGNAYREDFLRRGIPVVAIVDDSVRNAGPASLWVNPGAPADLRLPEGAAALDGPEYVLIRRAVRDLRSARDEALTSGEVHGLTFLLGGTDFGGLASEVSKLRIPPSRAGQVFAGPGSQEVGGNITWIEGGEGLLERAAMSRLVVSAAGVSSWELAHIGVPMALLQVTDNQAGNYLWMTTQGWAWPLGRMRQHGPWNLRQGVLSALDALDNSELRGSSRVDGLGARRLALRAMQLVET